MQLQNDYFFIGLVLILAALIITGILSVLGYMLFSKCDGFRFRAKIGYAVVTLSWIFCLCMNNLDSDGAIFMAFGGQITKTASIIFTLLVTVCFLYFLRKKKVF